MNKWIKCRNQLVPSREELADTNFDITASIAMLESAFDEHPLCKIRGSDKRIAPEYSGLFLYCIQLEDMMDNFEEFGMILPATVAVMRNIIANDPGYPSYIPVAGILLRDDAPVDKTSPLSVVMGKKKSIDLD